VVLAFIRTQPGLRARHRRYGTPLTQKWVRFSRQFGGLAKVDRPCLTVEATSAAPILFQIVAGSPNAEAESESLRPGGAKA
jgi:hypothetical protein